MDLINKTEELKRLQEHLIEDLKNRHKEAYEWLTENGIKLKELGLYAKQIAMALVVTFSFVVYSKDIQQNIQARSDLMFTHISRRNLDYLPEIEQQAVAMWKNYSDYVMESSKKYDIKPEIIFATIMVESVGDEEAMRYEPSLGESSYGLGQLLYSTATWIGFEGSPQKLLDPAINIDMIARYHRRNIDAFGELTPQQLALTYNAGSPYSVPTYGHVDKFMKWYNRATNLMRI